MNRTRRLIGASLALALWGSLGPVMAQADPGAPVPAPGVPAPPPAAPAPPPPGIPGLVLPWLQPPPPPEPEVPAAAPVTGVLDDWQKAVCAPDSFAPGSPQTMSRNWPGAVHEGTCASKVNPGLENTIWVTQWTANESMTSALKSNFMALFSSAATDQNGIVTFSVAQDSARKSLEPLTKFGFEISPVPPLS